MFPTFKSKFIKIYSLLSRLSTARGSCNGLATVSPAKVKACKSVINWCNETKISFPILMSGVYSFINLKSDSARMCKI